MTVWWSRRGVYEPPAELTALDLDWLAGHLRLAGLTDEDPPEFSAMSAAVTGHHIDRALQYANVEQVANLHRAQHAPKPQWRRGYSAIVDPDDVPLPAPIPSVSSSAVRPPEPLKPIPPRPRLAKRR